MLGLYGLIVALIMNTRANEMKDVVCFYPSFHIAISERPLSSVSDEPCKGNTIDGEGGMGASISSTSSPRKSCPFHHHFIIIGFPPRSSIRKLTRPHPFMPLHFFRASKFVNNIIWTWNFCFWFRVTDPGVRNFDAVLRTTAHTWIWPDTRYPP